MDTLLENKDFSIEENGRPFLINSMAETIQRCKILLEVPKESFIYDRNLGSEIRTLKTIRAQNQINTAKLLVKEALSSIVQVSVKNVVIVYCHAQGCKLRISICAYNEEAEFEVLV